MVTPLVSVIIPSFNYAQYLDKRIRSVLEQSYPNIECIIIDDASTDCSVEVIRNYENDARVTAIYHKNNSGHAYARWNEGAHIAKGEWILFAGADDWCDLSMIEMLVNSCRNEENVGIAFCESNSVDSVGISGKSWRSWTESIIGKVENEKKLLEGRALIYRSLNRNPIPNSSGALLRKSAFQTCNGYDLSLRLCSDWLLYQNIMKCMDVLYIPEELNYFRTHDNTVRVKESHSGVNIQEAAIVLVSGISALRLSRQDREGPLRRFVQSWTGEWLRMPDKMGKVHKSIREILRQECPEIDALLLAELPVVLRKLLRVSRQL